MFGERKAKKAREERRGELREVVKALARRYRDDIAIELNCNDEGRTFNTLFKLHG